LRDATTGIFACQRGGPSRTNCKFVFIRVHSWLDESAIPN
jgi:hypothetical protein